MDGLRILHYGSPVRFDSSGVFQHEFDHLDGILYPMRMDDLSLLVFTEEAQKFGLPEIEGEEEPEEDASEGISEDEGAAA